MRHLDVPVVLLHILEPFQVQRKYRGQFFDSHPLLGLLVTSTVITLELIFTTQCLCITETAQAMRDARVLLDVHLQIEEMFVYTTDRLAVQTTRFTR